MAAVWRMAVRLLLCLVFLALLAPVSEESPTALTERARDAQRILATLRTELSIDAEVQIALVVHHPFVFSVEPVDGERNAFRLSMETGFLVLLSARELRAALAHELGHVWIFTHHPFLQTEQLANDVGQRVVSRRDLERLYTRLWAYEGTDGVRMDTLLGPAPEATR